MAGAMQLCSAKLVQDLKTGYITWDFGALAHGTFVSVPKIDCAYLVKTQRNSTWNSCTLVYSRVYLPYQERYQF